MKCRNLFSWKNKKSILVCRLLKILPRVLCIHSPTFWHELLPVQWTPGPSCSKLTMSLVNDLLKFTLSDMQICWNFLLKATHIFSAKNIRILYIESAKTVNETTLKELVNPMMLWTTGSSLWISMLIALPTRVSKQNRTGIFYVSIFSIQIFQKQ